MASHFTKTLSKTDVEKRLAVPTKYMKHLPEFRGAHEVNLAVRDVHGTEWHFGYAIRKKDHPKPILSSGWSKFVKYKYLRPGDRVIFKLEVEPNFAAAPLYTIGVTRRIRLLGKEVWTAML